MANGKGKFYYADGSIYDGQMKNNCSHGYGKIIKVKNDAQDIYEGNWEKNQIHGKGK